MGPAPGRRISHAGMRAAPGVKDIARRDACGPSGEGPHPCGWCQLAMTDVNSEYSRISGDSESSPYRFDYTKIMEQSIIKAAIIEDQRDIREGLTMLIDGTPGYECTGSYRSMEEALDRIKAQVPDVVLCDIGLPGMSGIEGIR